MEKFREPHLWLQARENYSKSVAVTSMGMFIVYLLFYISLHEVFSTLVASIQLLNVMLNGKYQYGIQQAVVSDVWQMDT